MQNGYERAGNAEGRASDSVSCILTGRVSFVPSLCEAEAANSLDRESIL